MTETVAVLDVGKSNVKLALVDMAGPAVIASRSMPNRVRTDGPYPHFDLESLWAWLLAGLRELSAVRRIDAIATTTHGACFVLLAGDGLALPALDYEFAGPETVAVEYAAMRGGFQETLSPALPGGLNAGRQLLWLRRAFPDDFGHADTILPYPQYWAMRLTGRKVSEVTSFGAHTDLWNPRAATFSRLPVAEGWAERFPATVLAWQTVGTVLPGIAALTGLRRDCRVVAGIHDSNAALLPHLLSRPLPFAVLSTGTWMITFAPGGGLDRLDPARDCLANVDAFARPVPSAMCMAGREFEMLTGSDAVTPTPDDVRQVVSAQVMALPSLVAGSGPFGQRSGGWSVDPAGLSPGMRAAAASLYVALLADTCLRLTGADGPVIVEGPFARNRVFLGALQSIAGQSVLARAEEGGSVLGSALLALGGKAAVTVKTEPVAPLAVDLAAYAAEWRRVAGRGGKSLGPSA